MALALPKDGRLLACDITDRYIGIGRDHWEAAGVAHKIDVRIAPALETLDEEIGKGALGTYDLAFIDADKRSYESYFERCLTLVRIGGVIAIDNVLWGGRVAAEKNDVRTVAIRSFNRKLLHDSRVDIVLVPIGDGLMLACKR